MTAGDMQAAGPACTWSETLGDLQPAQLIGCADRTGALSDRQRRDRQECLRQTDRQDPSTLTQTRAPSDGQTGAPSDTKTDRHTNMTTLS